MVRFILTHEKLWSQECFYHFYFLNMGITVTVHDFELKSSAQAPNIPLDFDLGPSSNFMSNNWLLLCIFLVTMQFLHF